MKYWLLILIAGFATGCGILFEEDLSKDTVDMLSPPNGYVTPTQTQTFVWDSMPGALYYKFQLVSKRFDFIEDYVLDTTLTERQLTLALSPRQYQWRVIGGNNAGESGENIFDLTVQNDTTLVNQLVNTIAPTSSALYESDSVAFLWSTIDLANQYHLQVATSPTFNSQTISKDTMTPNDFVYLINDLGVGTFYWRMRAMRVGIDTTLYNTTQQFSISVVPTLVAPANNSTLTLPFNMDWQTASNTAKDSLFLYHNNTATPYAKIELFTNNYTFNTADTTSLGAGIYYWKVRSVANNGIVSGFSALRQFTIN